MFLSDRLTLDAPKLTSDGFLAVRARAARVGVYQYDGSEVDPENTHGLRDSGLINVLRDEATVFDKAAVHSFIGKPITDDHPKTGVNSTNWRDLSRGTIMGAMRDGDHLAFDLMVTDQSAIDKINAGKRELSNGYTSDLEFGDFTATDGTKCQARQKSIKGNHIALVDRGRAGPSCAIKDAAHCDSAPSSFLDSFNKEKPAVKNFLLDGLPVNLADADTAVATITTVRDQRDVARKEVTDLQTQIATLTTDKATLDAKVTTLEQQVKDAVPTPAQLRDAARAYAVTAAKAKKLNVAVTDTMDEPAIMKAVVDAKLGDKAKGWTDAQIAASFGTMTADIKVEDRDPMADLIRDGISHTDGIDIEGDRAKRRRTVSDAWRQPAAANA